MAKSNMYYEDNRDLAHDFKTLKFELLGMTMQFKTDAGVFSKSSIDYGSRTLLEAFRPVGESLLDVGCGYGTLGLTLTKKYGLVSTLSDVNPRALELAKENAALNHSDVNILISSVYEEIAGSFDNIVTNPPIRAGKEIVHSILEGAYDHLNSGGQILAVLQKKQGAPSAQKKMAEVFRNCEIVRKDKGYYILKSIKTKG
ncbi:MAG: class I SAM-dependent methyltransferase [Streptococcaceae bacterium]|jgi:16S rRNA (guanine1207-N2)-methyltransferase|nr:class I SAM-dependent methyltransferase [Streptococcaceae bacterium]